MPNWREIARIIPPWQRNCAERPSPLGAVAGYDGDESGLPDTMPFAAFGSAYRAAATIAPDETYQPQSYSKTV